MSVTRYYGVADNATTSLTATIDSATTSIAVASAAVFAGAELPFVITVSDTLTDANMEKMVVTAIASNILTVTRAFQTAGVGHANGSSVALRVVAQTIKDLNDNALMQIQQSSYIEHTKNGNNQVTSSRVWVDNTLTQKQAQVTYTYPDSISKLPSTAVRLIYKSDGTTVRRTETTTFTWVNSELVNVSRTVV